MKKIFLLSLIFLNISCEKEKYIETPYNPTTKELIVGVWVCNQMWVNHSNTNFNNYEHVIKFFDDGTGIEQVKDKLNISYNYFNWEINDNDLIIKQRNFDISQMTIFKFSINQVSYTNMELMYKHNKNELTFFFKKRDNSIGR